MPRAVPQSWESSALLFADNSTDVMDVGSGSVLDNVSVGTMIWWGYWPSVANVARTQWSKVGGTNAHFCFRRSGDGTTLRFQWARSGAAYTVDSSTGMLAANQWMCVAVSWDIAGGTGRWDRGTLAAAMTNYGASPTVGSGTHDDGSANLSFGYGISGNSDNMRIAAAALFNRGLSLAEKTAWQFSALDDPYPAVMAGCVGLWYPGREGGAKALDYSGFHNDGAITGATLSRGVTLLTQDEWTRSRPRYLGSTAAASTYGFNVFDGGIFDGRVMA